MKWESDSPCCSHTNPGQECWSPGRCSGRELEFRGCGAIPGWGLLLTVETWIEGMWGRRLWWEMLVEQSQEAMVARRYCWVMLRGWNHHRSLSIPHMAASQLNSREDGPSNTWHTELQSTIPARVAPLCAWRTEQQRRTPGKGAP